MTIEEVAELASDLLFAAGPEPFVKVDDGEILIGRDEVVLSLDATNDLGQPWGVAPLNYNPGGFDRRSGDGEPPSLESGGWTSYGSAQEACRAAVLLLVTLRMDAYLAGMAEEGAER